MKPMLLLLILFSLLPAQIIERMMENEAITKGDTVYHVKTINDTLRVIRIYKQTDTLTVIPQQIKEQQ
jgi:hypothetical protein